MISISSGLLWTRVKRRKAGGKGQGGKQQAREQRGAPEPRRPGGVLAGGADYMLQTPAG